MEKRLAVTAIRLVARDEDGTEVFIDLPSVIGDAILASSLSEPSAFGEAVPYRHGSYRAPTLRFVRDVTILKDEVEGREFTVRGAVGDVPSGLFDELRPHHDAVKRR